MASSFERTYLTFPNSQCFHHCEVHDLMTCGTPCYCLTYRRQWNRREAHHHQHPGRETDLVPHLLQLWVCWGIHTNADDIFVNVKLVSNGVVHVDPSFLLMPTFVQQSITLRPAARSAAQAAPLRGPSAHLHPLPAKGIVHHSLPLHQGTDDLGHLTPRRGESTPAPQAGNKQLVQQV